MKPLHLNNIQRATLVLTAVLLAPVAVSLAGDHPMKGKKNDDKKDDLPKFEDVTKDMTVKEGFFTLYYDKKKDVLLGRIPKSMLNEPFLMSVSIPKGPMYAGWMLGGTAVYWERYNGKLVLMEADTRNAKGKGSTLEDVIGRTYTDRILKGIKVKTEAPGGDPVIDLGDLLKSDIIGLGSIYGNRHIDRSLSQWSTHKAFPNNVELAVDAALMGSDGGMIASVHLSLSKLPKNHYTPREADDRIGYFLTAQRDWSVDHQAKTVFKRFVHRWNLQKQDAKAAESPVKEPIVFYIEKTVPVPYRRFVREGILEWNKAFQKCGFLDAVQVRQQTDTNEFKDLDPEDVRYNFFRWIVSGRAFARGPSRVNPFTGQILDADIVFDDSMARYYVNDYRLMGADAYDQLSDPVADELLKNFPEYSYQSPQRRLTPDFVDGRHALEDSVVQQPATFLLSRGESPCELATGMVQQLAFNQLLHTSAESRDLPEEFIGQVIKEVVMHEVGHTLGLRHNFKASTWRSVDDIVAANDEERALTGSVMDYNPSEFASSKEEQGSFVTRTLGPYDFWAIEYGYRPFMAGGEVKSEKDMLATITSRVAEPGLAYATDEDTSVLGPDPYVNRFDNGDDPVAFAKHRMKLVDHLMDDLVDRAVDDGESYSRLRRAFNIVLGQYTFAAQIAARMVGGQSINRDHKGDPNGRDPFQIVPLEKQREAFAFLGDTVFSDTRYQFPPEVLNKLGAGRFGHWDSDQIDWIVDYNVHDRVLAIQARILTILINPMTINRIYDAELKIPSDQNAFTVQDLFTGLTDMIWSELADDAGKGPWTNRRPRISSFRRNLQREHLRRMISIVLSKPGRAINADAHAITRMTLKQLHRRIQTVLKKSGKTLDTYTLAHLDEAADRIQRCLDAEFTDGASRSRSGFRF